MCLTAGYQIGVGDHGVGTMHLMHPIKVLKSCNTILEHIRFTIIRITELPAAHLAWLPSVLVFAQLAVWPPLAEG